MSHLVKQASARAEAIRAAALAGADQAPTTPTKGPDGSGNATKVTPAGTKVVPANTRPAGSGLRTTNNILVKPTQKSNPVLLHIRSVPWEMSEIVPDFQVGAARCLLYLSLRYHQLHPDYIHKRIADLGQSYVFRGLIISCDVTEHEQHIQELTKVSVVNNLTIFLAFSHEDTARYIELMKMMEFKSADVLQEHVAQDYMSVLRSVLSKVKGISKTDVLNLATNFKNLAHMAKANAEDFALLNGFGEVKGRRLADALNRPFRNA